MDQQEIKRLLLDPLAHGLGAVLIVAAGWLALRFLLVPLRRLLERGRVDPGVVSFLSNSLRTVVLVVVLLGILQQFGITTASLLTLLGAAGLAVALSLQSSLANFASGLLILAFRIARVGDWIECGDVAGRVAELLPFHVVLISRDNQRIVVPNSVLANGSVRNHSALATRRLEWSLPLGTDDDLARVKAALRSRLEMDPRILREPAPDVYVQSWAREGRTLRITSWTPTSDFLVVQQELLEQLGQALMETRPTATHDATS